MADGCGMMKDERDTKEKTYSARNTDPAISGLARDRYGQMENHARVWMRARTNGLKLCAQEMAMRRRT